LRCCNNKGGQPSAHPKPVVNGVAQQTNCNKAGICVLPSMHCPRHDEHTGGMIVSSLFKNHQTFGMYQGTYDIRGPLLSFLHLIGTQNALVICDNEVVLVLGNQPRLRFKAVSGQTPEDLFINVFLRYATPYTPLIIPSNPMQVEDRIRANKLFTIDAMVADGLAYRLTPFEPHYKTDKPIGAYTVLWDCRDSTPFSDVPSVTKHQLQKKMRAQKAKDQPQAPIDTPARIDDSIPALIAATTRIEQLEAENARLRAYIERLADQFNELLTPDMGFDKIRVP